MITFKCEACKKKITTDDSLAGQQGECPFCKAVVVAPGTPSAAGAEGARCPKCGGRRQEMRRTCGFCGADFDAPVSEPPKTRRVEVQAKTTRRKVVEQAAEPVDRRKVAMILGAVAAAGLVVLGFQFFGGGGDDQAQSKWTPDDLCRINMLALYDGLVAAQAHPESFPKSTGRAFWVEIAGKRNLSGNLKCPVAKSSYACDFRGPAKEFKEMGPEAIIAADPPDIHSGGVNVLLKHGDVLFAAKGTPLYDRVMTETKD